MGTDISGITKTIMQARSSLKAEASGNAKGQKATVSFTQFMSQSASQPSNTAFRMEPAEKNTTKAAYDSCYDAAKSVAVKEEAVPEELVSEASGLMEGYEEDIREILKEELGVTDEEINRAMELLGMDFSDFSNLKELAALVQELTGEDIGTLFLSEAFQNVKEQVMAVTEELCGQLGITKEEWNLISDALAQNKPEHALPSDDISDGIPKETEIPKDPAPVEKDEALPEHNGSGQDSLKGQEQKAAAVKEAPQQEPVYTEETRQEGQKVQGPGQSEMDARNAGTGTQPDMADSSDADADSQGTMEHAKTVNPETVNTNPLFVDGQAGRTEEFVPLQQEAAPFTGQTDAMELIEQIAKNVRVTISAETTSMEMQLNPENLGKIYLNISEKEGAVRAQIAAQNQMVKEALETQVAELRQSLSQQGIKVDAIEVTVATHEFEQNLEENARQQEQARRQMEESQKQGRRSLNLNDLDELSGLMTEEEQLAAQIMRDNGNQVDLTA